MNRNQFLLFVTASRTLVTTCAAAALLPAAALSQDSVSLTNCTPGDAVLPWDLGEQENRFVVDLTTFSSSWGTEFTLGPVSKTSKSGSTFFNSLISAQGISRTSLVGVPIPGAYGVWNTAGQGVNDDQSINDPASSTDEGDLGIQLAAAYAEFGDSDGGVGVGGVVSNVLRYDPVDPTRMFVERTIMALTGSDEFSEVSSFGFGSVDSQGNVAFRADGFGIAGGSSVGNFPLFDNSILLVEQALRDTGALNVVSFNQAANFDGAATEFAVFESPSTFNTPAIAEIGGGPFYIGTNFDSEYAYGVSDPPTLTGGHLAAGNTDQRGGLSHSEKNFALLGSTEGVCAILAQQGGPTQGINLFGIDGTGAVTGNLSLILPSLVGDNDDGFTNLPGQNSFDHYGSQVAFRGGNGQIALNLDHAGNLLAAAAVDHPDDPGSDWGVHYIAVARVSPTGTVEWTMAAYQDGLGGGKPILDGPGGAVIGELTELSAVTGGFPVGPSLTSPMLDSYGNVYFYGAYQDFAANDARSGLFRSVYDPVNFSYQLELLFTTGEVFNGLNSNRDYQIRFVPIADNNSINSSAAFSQNITSDGHAGQAHFGLPGEDSKHLGGLVLGAQIVYDRDADGDFDECAGFTPDDPTSGDQDYQVLLYVGSPQACQLDVGGQGSQVIFGGGTPEPGDLSLTVCGEGLNAGETSAVRVTNASPNEATFILLSQPGLPSLPVGTGSAISAAGLLPGFPLAFTSNAAGELLLSLNGTGTPSELVLQAIALNFDGLPTITLEISNAVLLKYGQ